MINMKMDTTCAKVRKYIRMASVRKLSITSTSLEKRLIILPRGVVSKNHLVENVSTELVMKNRKLTLAREVFASSPFGAIFYWR